MLFEFHRFRFWFRAAGGLYFPPGQSANIVRGAFGHIFRGLVCRPECPGAQTCEARSSCAYARVFEPRAALGAGPSGLADWPRPFVFRAAHLDGRRVAQGEAFHFDVHLFDTREPALPHFIAAFAELARQGLGPGRGLAELTGVDQLDLDGAAVRQVFRAPSESAEIAAPCAVDLAATPPRLDRATVRFLTPTELKSGERLAERPEFPILFARLRNRIAALRALYGAGPLEIDFRGMGERAAAVRLERWECQWHEAERRSSRTGQRQPLGGFTGEAEYEGPLAEFAPYLALGRWVGVGRQTVWGKGEIEFLPNFAPLA
ncbi:MAG TPA: CRISPR system precrRNA processing endoribonuclease RAMP protein Cas6 [Bryobacteraceae bacterium]|nr:CRISPR system precrRNA processing endoribonuclease RAMP protein Cas6 [Bryobacteraceae bacterium]